MMNPRATTTTPFAAPLLTRQARTKPLPGEVITMARETRLDPELETIRERSDQVTRSAALMRIIARHEVGEQFPEPRSGGPAVQLAWTLPLALAARFPLRPKEQEEVKEAGIEAKLYSPELRARLINAALFELAAEFEDGWGERVGIRRGWDGMSYQFPAIEAWTAGEGQVITRGVLRRVGEQKPPLPLEFRPLAVGITSSTPAYPRESGQNVETLWELLDITETPEPRTLAVIRAANAYAAVQEMKGGRFQDLGLAPLDAQLHRYWRGKATRKTAH